MIDQIVSAARTRRPQVLSEPLTGKPFDLFLAVTPPHRWVGRKTPARGAGTPPQKCCLVESHMLCGLLERDQLTAEGVALHYRPLRDDEKRLVHEAFTTSPRHDLHYPYARIGPDGAEPVADPGFWRPTPERVRELDRDEEPLRRHALSTLERHGIEPGVIYDPACSTGAFLSTLKQHFPGALTVGQDASVEMAAYAGTHVDRVVAADARNPVLGNGEADLVVCRHLNVDVVTAADARALFGTAAGTCRDGGWMIVLGHTPVLLASEHFEADGLEVVERSGATPDGAAVFQFYLLRKPGP